MTTVLIADYEPSLRLLVSATIASDEYDVDRARFGLASVAFDPATLKVARLRAAAEIPNGPLSHTNSLGEVAFVGLLGDAGVQYSLAGENLARASAQDAGVVPRLDEALMNSPTHRANILEPSFNLLAVGGATGPDGRLAFARIFRSAIVSDTRPAVRPRCCDRQAAALSGR